jgi:hypothetical protein
MPLPTALAVSFKEFNKLPEVGDEVDEDDDVSVVSVVVSFLSCRLKCCLPAIRALARCRCLNGNTPSAVTKSAVNSPARSTTDKIRLSR